MARTKVSTVGTALERRHVVDAPAGGEGSDGAVERRREGRHARVAPHLLPDSVARRRYVQRWHMAGEEE